MVRTVTNEKVALYVRKSREGENGVDETLHTQRGNIIKTC